MSAPTIKEDQTTAYQHTVDEVLAALKPTTEPA